MYREINAKSGISVQSCTQIRKSTYDDPVGGMLSSQVCDCWYTESSAMLPGMLFEVRYKDRLYKP